MPLRFRPSSCEDNSTILHADYIQLGVELGATSIAVGCLGSLGLGLNLYFLARLLANLRRGWVPRKRFVFIASVAAADVVLSGASVGFAVLRGRLGTAFAPCPTGRLVILALSALSVLLYSYIALILLQFSAVAFPLLYRRLVTLRRCIAAVASFWALELGLYALLSLYAAALGDQRHTDHILEVTLVCTNLETVLFFTIAVLVYGATFAYVRAQTGDLDTDPRGRHRHSFLVNLGGHMGLFTLTGLPHVAGDLWLLALRPSSFAYYSDPALAPCYLRYHHQHRASLRWLDVGLALTLVRSVGEPLVYLWSEAIPPLLRGSYRPAAGSRNGLRSRLTSEETPDSRRRSSERTSVAVTSL